jgi:acetoacetate decarboxylase
MIVKPIIDSSFSMPRVAPLYTAPPFQYQGNRMINIMFRTTPEILRSLVPPPLVANPASLIFIYVAQFNIVLPSPFKYKEAGIGVPVSFSGMEGQYAVYLFLEDAGAIAAGREIYGFPKKDSQISFLEEKEAVTAQVVRAGVTLIDATVYHLERSDSAPQQTAELWFNLKVIPSVKKDALPDVMQLTSTLVPGENKELYSGAAGLKFGSSLLDPLGDIPIVEILQGTYSIGDFTLGYGEVVYDYLAKTE